MPEISCSPSSWHPLPASTLPQLRQCKCPQRQGNCRGSTNGQTCRHLWHPQSLFMIHPRGDTQFKCKSWEAINILTKCIWAKSPKIFTPTKLMAASTSTCLDYNTSKWRCRCYTLSQARLSAATNGWWKTWPKLKPGRWHSERILMAWCRAIKRQGKRGKLHFCYDSRQNLPHAQRINCHICARHCWLSSPERGPPLHSYYCWGQLNQVSRQTLDKNSQPHHFQADVEQCPWHKGCKIYVLGYKEFLSEYTSWLIQIYDDAFRIIPEWIRTQ